MIWEYTFENEFPNIVRDMNKCKQMTILFTKHHKKIAIHNASICFHTYREILWWIFFCRFGSATSEPVAIEWFCQLALLNFLFWCEMYQFLSSINILAAQSMTYWKLTKTNEMGFIVLFLLIHTMIQSKDLSAQSEYSKVHFHAG